MSRQQKWAQAAFEAVREAKAKSDEKKAKSDEKKYGTYCMKLPSLLLQSGLVQTTAFLRSRGEPAADLFLDDVAKVLEDSSKATGRDLDAKARKASLPDYLRLSRDALHVASWFRRFAQTELEVSPDEVL